MGIECYTTSGRPLSKLIKFKSLKIITPLANLFQSNDSLCMKNPLLSSS